MKRRSMAVVQKILSERKNVNGTRSYLIDWGIDYTPTWEPSEVIESDCPEMVASFNVVSNQQMFLCSLYLYYLGNPKHVIFEMKP